ncbi:MAG TPA: aquaporin [Rhabdochlamydiaceae bacterium]|nr:aquaporin [Rhabdochlamydiaceae bacterium]
MKYIYEFIGTFFLVFTVGMTMVSPGEAGMWAPLAIGSVLAVMIFACGHVSGGHLNPAISLAAFMRGKLKFVDMWLYWLAQFAAAVVAAYFTVYFKGAPSNMHMDLDMGRVIVAEFLFTFALCYVMLNVATAKETKGNSYYGLAIGFTVLAGAYAVGATSSAAFNPAVALSNSILNLTVWPNLWYYFLGSFCGAAVAAWVFNVAHPKE